MDRPMGMKKAKLLKKLEDAGALSSTTTGPPQGSNMDRPMGMKKAKLLKKLEDAGALSSTTTGFFLDSVSDSRNTEEESMIANTSCYKRTCFGVEGCYVTQAG
jgi:hypothetical protein